MLGIASEAPCKELCKQKTYDGTTCTIQGKAERATEVDGSEDVNEELEKLLADVSHSLKKRSEQFKTELVKHNLIVSDTYGSVDGDHL